MATCNICGSTLVHFENPSRDICPTPERHKTSRTIGRATRGGKGKKGGSEKRPGKK